MKKIKFILLVIACSFASQTFAGVAVSRTPIDGDSNVFWTVDFTDNDLYDHVKIEVNFLPTFDSTTFIHNAIIQVFDYKSRTSIRCYNYEFVSRRNFNLGINYSASAALITRTKGNSKFSDKIKIISNNSKCIEVENGDEGASPSVNGSVFTGVTTMTPPVPYPQQSIASYTHEAHFNSKPGTSKGSLKLSANGLTRILTLTYKTGEVFSCSIPVGSNMDDFVLAAKPHVVWKGGKYNIRKNLSGYRAGSCASFTIIQDSRNLL